MTYIGLKSGSMVKFSVSGLRGKIGEALTSMDFAKTCNAYVQYMDAGKMLLAHDARVSGVLMKNAAFCGLLAAGASITDAGMVTTPTAVFGTGSVGADAGVVITASHNPADENGLKFLEKDRFLIPARAAEFVDFVSSCHFIQVPAGQLKEVTGFDAQSTHRKAVLDLVGHGGEPRLRVGLDPVNGAAGPEAKKLLEGMNCEVFEINYEPNGRFGRGTEPVTENLIELRALVSEKGLDLGFAFDPDGDRLALIDEQGRAPGEEYTVPLCSHWALSRNKGDIVVNLSTSRLIDYVGSEFGVKIHRSPVGESHVVDKLIEVEGCCGGEGNGGFILPSFNATRDGLLAMAVLVKLKRGQGSLADMIDNLPRYCRQKEKFAIEWSQGLAQRVISQYPTGCISQVDGLWLGEDDFWLHLRPSNTEPVVRLIVEAEKSETLRKVTEDVKKICAE